MKKFIDSVKALGEKMTGKEIEGTKLIDVIDETAENYQGGAGSGSKVVANPELVGGEATLDGIEVDGVNYVVPQGGITNLYLHRISIYKENGCFINFSFTNSTSTKYDERGLFSLFMGSRIPCSGIVIDNGSKNVLNCEFSQLFKINIAYFATPGSLAQSPYQLTGKYSIEDNVKQVM